MPLAAFSLVFSWVFYAKNGSGTQELPFSPKELIARVRAILRRRKAPPHRIERYRFGNIDVDFKKFATTRGGQLVDLTPREYALLRFLIERRDGAVSRFDILEEVWE